MDKKRKMSKLIEDVKKYAEDNGFSCILTAKCDEDNSTSIAIHADVYDASLMICEFVEHFFKMTTKHDKEVFKKILVDFIETETEEK